MLRVVLDTNVLVSAVLNERGPPGQLLDLVLNGELQAISEPRVVAEYRDVLARPKLNLHRGHVEALLEVLESVSLQVAAPPWPARLPDPDDEVFIATAAFAQAILVTGNIKHFPTSVRRGTAMMTPRDLWDRLRLALARR